MTGCPPLHPTLRRGVPLLPPAPRLLPMFGPWQVGPVPSGFLTPPAPVRRWRVRYTNPSTLKESR